MDLSKGMPHCLHLVDRGRTLKHQSRPSSCCRFQRCTPYRRSARGRSMCQEGKAVLQILVDCTTLKSKHTVLML